MVKNNMTNFLADINKQLDLQKSHLRDYDLILENMKLSTPNPNKNKIAFTDQRLNPDLPRNFFGESCFENVIEQESNESDF